MKGNQRNKSFQATADAGEALAAAILLQNPKLYTARREGICKHCTEGTQISTEVAGIRMKPFGSYQFSEQYLFGYEDQQDWIYWQVANISNGQWPIANGNL